MARRRRYIRWAAMMMVLMAVACASTTAPSAGRIGGTEEGLATYYSSRFIGRKTASGQRYDPAALTAAHRSLPFGTKVRVSRTDGVGEPVVVRINDRGPFGGGRIIDVSLAAAKRLRMVHAGVVRVRVERVRR